MTKTAIIIGAGPAGLTAAYELLERTDIVPIILEKDGEIGGISRTINYKGNRMDIGPHRFFSKSDRVMDWWLKMMPLEKGHSSVNVSYQNKTRVIEDPCSYHKESDTDTPADKRMLIIPRLTRIYFLRKFFAYPIQLSLDTLQALGLGRTIKILMSFLWVRLFPRKPEKSLKDLLINKFGQQLYLLFFKDYTEKVWGVPCHEISAEWGTQRIKGVSLSKAIGHAVKLFHKKGAKDIHQKDMETSLIEQFLYPKYGPGSLWEEVARQIEVRRGKIYKHQFVQSIYTVGDKVCSVHAINSRTGELTLFEGDYFFSTMPVQELIAGIQSDVPAEVKEVAAGLQYRDFINVGILLKQLSSPGKRPGETEPLELKDNWIYIQERDVKVGRLMIYNNWGGGMVKDPDTTWVGMEYFCNKSDVFWRQDDATIQGMAIMELEKMGLARVDDVLDITVQRMEKTYPAYFGTYNQFDKIRAYVDQYANLFLVGRNGMHKYNNADHSMLCSMVAVDNIMTGVTSKANLWAINTEQEYHEEKSHEKIAQPSQPVFHKKAPLAEPSFPKFIWQNKQNRIFLFIAVATYLIQFIIFKYYYPFANYMPDSYSYLEAAYRNLDVSTWPVAYSKFLRLMSVFTHSDTLVIACQYLFLQGSTLLFLFTLIYFLRPAIAFINILFLFFLFNPLPLYLANYISADALFIGMSLCWLTSLLWILYRPILYQVFAQAILLLFCFTFRYNAIYYPIISILAFLFTHQSWKFKTAGIAFGTLLVFVSVLYTSQKMQTVTGEKQFSAFGGWQLANNALYMYEHIPANERRSVPARFTKLEKMVREHLDTLSRVKLTNADSINGYFYLWNSKAPLIQYMVREWKQDTTTSYFKRWASEGPLYADYAAYLIRKYPVAFIRYFLLPNSIKYATPPVEFIGIYNMGSDSVGQLAKEWFNYKSQKVPNYNKKSPEIVVTRWYPTFFAMTNVLLLICLAGILVFGSLKKWNDRLPMLASLIFSFWTLNIGFSIFASPIVLRYQVFPLILFFCLAILLIEYILKQHTLHEK